MFLPQRMTPALPKEGRNRRKEGKGKKELFNLREKANTAPQTDWFMGGFQFRIRLMPEVVGGSRTLH